MKDETVIIRMTTELKKDLLSAADECRRDVSDYLRLLIEDAVKHKYDPVKSFFNAPKTDYPQMGQWRDKIIFCLTSKAMLSPRQVATIMKDYEPDYTLKDLVNTTSQYLPNMVNEYSTIKREKKANKYLYFKSLE